MSIITISSCESNPSQKSCEPCSVPLFAILLNVAQVIIWTSLSLKSDYPVTDKERNSINHLLNIEQQFTFSPRLKRIMIGQFKNYTVHSSHTVIHDEQGKRVIG